MKLTKEEKEIRKGIDRGDYKPVSKSEGERLEKIFKHAARKVTRINIRLTDEDILKLKSRAEREGVPYQTLIGGVLHKFVNGTLVNVDDIKTVTKLLKTG
jgi:predicted DNA binding CopG/RHH family protein